MGANAQTSVPAFTAGQVLTAVQVTQINTGIPVFASSTERDAAFGGTGEKTLAEGQMAYLEDTNATQYYDGSSWAAIAGGKILQVVQTEKTDSFSTTSSAYVDVTGVSVSITPSSATNKVLILLSGIGGINSTVQVAKFNLVRDSTNIAQSTGSAISDQTFIVYGTSIGSDSFSVTYLDSPATTSSTTYKLQMAVTGATGVVGRKADNDNFRAVTTITALEVSA